MGLFRRHAKTSAAAPPPLIEKPPAEPPLLNLRVTFRVVGTQHYIWDTFDVVREVTGRPLAVVEYHELTATLVAEPRNPHDSNAIAVTVGGRKIGHVARGDTAVVHEALRAAGSDRARCPVDITLKNSAAVVLLRPTGSRA